MKILMMAPHPLYQERGTPIAVDLLLRCLSEAGHQVDVVTFPEGEDRPYPGVVYHRVKPLGQVSGVRPGFSLKKLYLDLFVFFKFLSLMLRNRYQAVHAVEESVYMAMLVCPLFRIRYIYDMDSSMVTQLLDGAPRLKPLAGVLRFIESLPSRFASIVVTCCDAQADDIKHLRTSPAKPTLVLKDISLLDKSRTEASSGINVQQRIQGQSGQPASRKKVLMYIGNLEAYQGIDLMLEGFADAAARLHNIALVVVGGEPGHIDDYQAKSNELNIADKVFFLGKQPVTDLYALMRQADIMLSPRTHGINTPMKVYSYLDSNVPVLATRLPTHTQVMSDDNSMLVEPERSSFADGIERLINDDGLCRSLAGNAADMVQREHSLPAFRNTVEQIYAVLQAG